VKRNAQVELELEKGLPSFKGSILKLEQVLSNLILNASEAIDGDDGLIKIATKFDSANKTIILIVSDNGCGMDEKTKKSIFDPFFTTKRNRGGTGLGLSITYGIIKDHGGKIDVESRIGEGTRFIIRIPV
jgi:signal transduction histidine kinase